MPIRADLRPFYRKDWQAISNDVRQAAGWRCTMPGCSARHGQPHPQTGSIVQIQTMHLDHNASNRAPENLRAACQLCHNTYDRPHRLYNAVITRHLNRGQPDLFCARAA